ncbi:tetratricopeptide repeat protein [Pseudomonas mangrovi]|uniref:Uncharacterized protein n=1 Tax=Pseudomonas mangrovi TaxID=2161748 RepID=A0A2T5P932_9PSED|nr:tetratricopeptide repeat protein [Pseudomonas mangrovi]PTU74248.1 hypothetical protein DBO85_09075 [Pseudomonas mangrovi]
MSLVNDMLRDLEERRAGPEERLRLSGMHAVDEVAASRRERYERIRRGSIWFAAVVLIAVLVGLMLGRLVRGPVQPLPLPVSEPAVVAAPVPAPAQVLDVLPQHDGRRFVLQLLLDRSVSYRRVEESGAVSLLLTDVELAGETQSGRVQRDGRSLSWRVENRNGAVQVLLVGLSGEIEASDRLERAGDRWQLWVEVPLAEAHGQESAEPLSLPIAEPVQEQEAQVPEWMSRPVPAREPAVAVEPVVAPVTPAPAPAAPRNPDLRISSHVPDALSLARQALQDGDHSRAIREFQALQRARPADPEITRWLARAYLAAGELQQLQDWVTPRLAANPHDSELRMLLARGQLQRGEKAAAVATLEQHAPPLARDSAYHALLAALYQQDSDWQRSANLYQQLVALRPSQATWQLGLGVALEQLGRDADAARHYRMALQGIGLDEASRRFASERAMALGGRR